MFGLFGNRTRNEQYEKLLLIAESVKLGLSVPDAIDLVAADGTAADRPFIRLSQALKSGTVLADAVNRAGFPRSIRQTLLRSLVGDLFPELFAFQSQLAYRRARVLFELGTSLVYPFCLLLAIIVVATIEEMFTFPVIEQLYNDFGMTKPLMCQAIMDLCHLCSHGVGFVWLSFFFLFLFLLQKTCVPRLGYRLPVVGSLRLFMYQSMFLRTMAFLLRRGKPLDETLLACKTRGDNRAFRNDLVNAASDANRGLSPVDLTLRYPWLFPIWLAPLLLACESGDKQAEVLENGADWLDIQVHRNVVALQSIVLITVILCSAIVVFFFATTLMSPIINLTQSLSK